MRTLRRECLDHILALSERHVRAVLIEFVSYYNQDRPTDPIDRSVLKPRSGTVGRSMGRWLLGPSSAACTTSTNEPLTLIRLFAALQAEACSSRPPSPTSRRR